MDTMANAIGHKPCARCFGTLLIVSPYSGRHASTQFNASGATEVTTRMAIQRSNIFFAANYSMNTWDIVRFESRVNSSKLGRQCGTGDLLSCPTVVVYWS